MKMIDACCSQVTWRGQGARMPGIKGRGYKHLWSGKGDGFGGARDMSKAELCEKVVEVKGRVSDSDDCCGF